MLSQRMYEMGSCAACHQFHRSVYRLGTNRNSHTTMSGYGSMDVSVPTLITAALLFIPFSYHYYFALDHHDDHHMINESITMVLGSSPAVAVFEIDVAGAVLLQLVLGMQL